MPKIWYFFEIKQNFKSGCQYHSRTNPIGFSLLGKTCFVKKKNIFTLAAARKEIRFMTLEIESIWHSKKVYDDVWLINANYKEGIFWFKHVLVLDAYRKEGYCKRILQHKLTSIIFSLLSPTGNAA